MAPGNGATFLWRHAFDRRFGDAVDSTMDDTRRCRHPTPASLLRSLPYPKKYHGTYSQARVPPGLKGQTPRRSVRPNARAAGPRRPAEAGPWGAAKERRALWLNLARGRAKVWHRNDQNGSHVFHLVVPTSGATMKTPGAWGPLPSVYKWDYCSFFFVVGDRLASL